jgi:hypothetical protein
MHQIFFFLWIKFAILTTKLHQNFATFQHNYTSLVLCIISSNNFSIHMHQNLLFGSNLPCPQLHYIKS